MQPVPEEGLELKVADCVDEEGRWLAHKFSEFLPMEIQQQITALAVDPLATSDDSLLWRPTSNGRFSTKSAYHLMMPSPQGGDHKLWKMLWNLPVPERIRCFMWLLVLGKISSNEAHCQRHLTTESDCYRCAGRVETILHIFRECPPATYFWTRVVASSDQPAFSSMSTQTWLRKNILSEDTSITGIPWNAFYSIAVWLLWKNRNDGTFQGISKTLSAPSLTQAIKVKARLWYDAWKAPTIGSDRLSPPAQRIQAEIGWKLPPPGWWKLNVDGASNGNPGVAGAGGVLRGSDGRWAGGFCASLGCCSAVMAELWGLYHGLDIAWRHGCRTLMVESDSKLAIELVNNRTDPLHPYATLLAAIRRKIAQDWVVRLSHVYREGNRVADWLSKHSLVYPYGVHEMPNSPQALVPLLREDDQGVTFPRDIVPCPPSPSLYPSLLYSSVLGLCASFHAKKKTKRRM
ncbi:unnamed protein product [Linum trigynum]|uniref:RNase H type-1 domain-containing protein n=1 Tax=Linum trigynum TaxID=586398 RepID=A0AAV2G9B1_9ROSI